MESVKEDLMLDRHEILLSEVIVRQEDARHVVSIISIGPAILVNVFHVIRSQGSDRATVRDDGQLAVPKSRRNPYSLLTKLRLQMSMQKQ